MTESDLTTTTTPPRLRAIVYFDGFNFYNGCFGSGRDAQWKACKWLDLSKYCRTAFPSYTIEHIRYFTARVKSLPNNPDAPSRQATYLRALRTLPNVEIHLSRFYIQAKWRHLAHLPSLHRIPPRVAHKMPLKSVCVVNPEEKGSDVNLATHLLFDGFRGRYDVAIVISNDSDLAEPIRIVCAELGKAVVLVNPHNANAAFHLLKIPGVRYRSVRLGPLQASQFPPQLQDASGTITKPPTW